MPSRSAGGRAWTRRPTRHEQSCAAASSTADQRHNCATPPRHPRRRRSRRSARWPRARRPDAPGVRLVTPVSRPSQGGGQQRLVELHDHRGVQPPGDLGPVCRHALGERCGQIAHRARVGDRAVPAGQLQLGGQRDRPRRLDLDRPRPAAQAGLLPRLLERVEILVRAGWLPAAPPRCGPRRSGSRGARCRSRCRPAAHRPGRSCRRRRLGRAARRDAAGCAVRRRRSRRPRAATYPATIRCRSRRRKHSLVEQYSIAASLDPEGLGGTPCP